MLFPKLVRTTASVVIVEDVPVTVEVSSVRLFTPGTWGPALASAVKGFMVDDAPLVLAGLEA